MDWYTSYLLSRAVEAGGATFRIYRSPDDGWTTVSTSGPTGYADGRDGTGPTLADALMALLDDLGVSYEPRPSAERVREIAGDLVTAASAVSDSIADLDEFIADHEPAVTVLALLSGGEG